jgi:glycosyltransferase involved in cell wall biosynthesis
MRRRDPWTVLLANPGADLYGSDRMLLETARALRAAGFRVVTTVPEDGPLVHLLQAEGAEVRLCPTPIIRKSYLSPLGVLRLVGEAVRAIGPSRRLLRESGASTIVVNTVTPPLWLLLAKAAGIRAVCHVHEAERSVPRAVRTALYMPLAFADRIVLNSEFASETLLGTAPWLARRCAVVYNAVAGPLHVRPPRDVLEPPQRLLFVGRLSQRKGPHVAVEALALLRERGVDAHLSLLGAVFRGNEGYEIDLRRQVAALELGDYVHFLGFRPTIWDAVAESDIVLVPSTVDEPFGNTAVEAGLAARPLVVSDTSGLQEASEHSSSAIRVAPGDPGALADAVQKIGSTWSLYAHAAVRDAAVLRERFSSNRYARDLLDAFDLTPPLDGKSTPAGSVRRRTDTEVTPQ